MVRSCQAWTIYAIYLMTFLFVFWLRLRINILHLPDKNQSVCIRTLPFWNSIEWNQLFNFQYNIDISALKAYISILDFTCLTWHELYGVFFSNWKSYFSISKENLCGPTQLNMLRSAVGKTHVLRSRLVMNYTTSLVLRLYSEIDHIHLSSEAQCVSHLLPPGDCHKIYLITFRVDWWFWIIKTGIYLIILSPKLFQAKLK